MGGQKSAQVVVGIAVIEAVRALQAHSSNVVSMKEQPTQPGSGPKQQQQVGIQILPEPLSEIFT